MKYGTIVLCFLFCFCFTMLSAQIGFVSQITITESNNWSYTPRAVFPCSDGSTIVIGEVIVWTEWYDFWNAYAVKVDSLGNTVWINRLQLSTNDEGCGNVAGIDMDNDGIIHFMINGWNSIELYSLDQNGNFTQDHVSQMANIDHIKKAIRLPNGEIACAIDYMESDSLSSHLDRHAAFLRLSENGDSLALHSYLPDLGSEDTTAWDMVLDSDGLPLITCTLTMLYKASVIKTDLDGNLIFRRDINLMYYSFFPVCISKLPGSNRSFIMVSDFIDPYSTSYCTIYSLQDSLLVHHSNFQPSLQTYLTQILCVQDGYIMSGVAYDGYYIGKFGLGGHVIWDSLFVGGSPFRGYDDDFESIKTLQSTADNCIIDLFDSGVCGFTMVKFLPNGTVTGNEDEASPPVPVFKMDIYPNPIIHNTHIQITDSKSLGRGEQTVSIYNIRGQLVRKLSLNRKDANLFEAEWNGTDQNSNKCAAGVYLVRTDDQKDSISKKVILMR